MVDSTVEVREGTAGTTGGTAVIVADGIVVVPDGWIGVIAIVIEGIIPVIGGLTGASGKPLHSLASGAIRGAYRTAFYRAKFVWVTVVRQFRSIAFCEYSRRAR
jgi:hypothetical protein